MKKRSILISLFVLTISASAQEASPISSSVTLPESKKNELCINVAPVFRMLLNAAASKDADTRYSATYKRNLNERSAFRFSLMADVSNTDPYGYKHPGKEVIILSTDSVLIKEKIISNGIVSPHLCIGYERLFGKNKLKWFYGTDLSLGYAKSNSEKQRATLFRDTTQGLNSWVETQPFYGTIVAKTNAKVFSVGMAPFFGAKYPIYKNLMLSAQVGFDMSYKKITNTETTATTNNVYHFSTFDFSEDAGIVNDISLIYRF